MTRLKAILSMLFRVARRHSESGATGHPRFGRADMGNCQALLLEDDTPEHERGEW